MEERAATRVVVKDGPGKARETRVWFREGVPLVDRLTCALEVEWNKEHELGWEMTGVGGKRSKYYHFVIVDEKTGKRYMPYVEVGGGNGERKRIYLDFRNILFDPDFMRGKAIEIFLAYDHRDMENSVKTRYDGRHASFMLDEFTSADLKMADVGRMMKKYYIGNTGEECRFHFMGLRARMLLGAGRRLPAPPPAFSFDGTGFSFSLPAAAAREEAPAVPEAVLGAPGPVMLPESQPWLDAAAGMREEREGVPALLASVPALPESPAAAAQAEADCSAVGAPPPKSLAAKADAPVDVVSLALEAPPKLAHAGASAHCAASAHEGLRQECGRESKSCDEDRSSAGSGESGTGHGGGGKSGGSDGAGGGREQGGSGSSAHGDGGNFPRRGRPRKKRQFKPVPLFALSSFRAAIFDLDGVVTDSQPLHLATFNKALEPLGVRIGGRAWKEKYPGVGSYAVFKDVFARNGISASVEEYVERRAGIYYKELKKARVPEIAGFGTFRRELEGNGIGVAVASGGHLPHIRESLRAAGMEKVAFVGLENVRRPKPAPDLFLLAARRLRVKPSECVVFEDALSGMQAAASAGMPCVALATTLPAGKLRGKAALVVRDFRDKKLWRLLAVLLERRKKPAPSGRRKG